MGLCGKWSLNGHVYVFSDTQGGHQPEKLGKVRQFFRENVFLPVCYSAEMETLRMVEGVPDRLLKTKRTVSDIISSTALCLDLF